MPGINIDTYVFFAFPETSDFSKHYNYKQGCLKKEAAFMLTNIYLQKFSM